MAVDWHAVFGLTVAPLELIVRGTVLFWFIFLVFRVVLRREVGSVAIADLLVLVLIADAAQNGMAGGYQSVTDALILLSVIIGWNMLIDWAAFRVHALERLLQPRRLCLIRDGMIQHANRRRELLSVEELMSKLREQGVAQLAEVRRAYMEADGNISVLRQLPDASIDDQRP